LDVASIKGRLNSERSVIEKRRFLEITRMLVGLRKAWLYNAVSEEPSPYQVEPSRTGVEVVFHHESLDMYQVGLQFMRWFVCLPGGGELSDRLCREVDRSATSVVLNIAEGNGGIRNWIIAGSLKSLPARPLKRPPTWTSTNKRPFPPRTKPLRDASFWAESLLC
jgi:hypothetical protein